MQENTAAIIPAVPEAKRAAGNKTDIHITARAAAAGMIFQPMIAAINAALNSFNKVLLAEHIRTCVAQDIRDGNDEVVDELVQTLQKLMR